ncbi:MAG: MFS transporter, partial [Pseudonocardia sediminis]
IAPVVGAWADRVPRKVLMVGADLVRAAVVLMLPMVTQVWQVYLLIALLQAASATFTPTFQSVLPDVLPDEDDYTRALSASQFAVSAENILSPLLAAALLTVVEFHSLFLGTTAGFLCSAALVVGAVVPAGRRSTHDRFRDRLVVGMRIFAATPRLRGVLALNMVVAACGVIALVSTVNVARDLLGGSQTDVALLLAVSGAGTAVAALSAPWLLRRHTERSVMLAGAAVSVAAVLGALVLSLVPGWGLAAAVWALVGAGPGAIMVVTGRVVRRSTGARDRPAAFAAQFSLSHACWLLTYPLTGWVGSLAGFTAAWALLAVLVAAASVLAVRVWPRGLPDEFRHVHDGSEDEDHLAHAEWDGAVWTHVHRVVIDDNHTRWPTPVH